MLHLFYAFLAGGASVGGLWLYVDRTGVLARAKAGETAAIAEIRALLSKL